MKSNKELIVALCLLALMGPAWLFWNIGSSGGLRQHHTRCLELNDSDVEPNHFLETLVDYGKSQKLHRVDKSAMVQRLTEKNDTVDFSIYSRRYFPTFHIFVELNPKYGGSTITTYGRQNLSPEAIDHEKRLLGIFASTYGITAFELDGVGGCT